MSIFVSNSEHSLNPVKKISQYKKTIREYEKFQKVATIIPTASGLASFIYSSIDITGIMSVFSGNEEVSRMVTRFVVPVISFVACSAFVFYDRNKKN